MQRNEDVKFIAEKDKRRRFKVNIASTIKEDPRMNEDEFTSLIFIGVKEDGSMPCGVMGSGEEIAALLSAFPFRFVQATNAELEKVVRIVGKAVVDASRQ